MSLHTIDPDTEWLEARLRDNMQRSIMQSVLHPSREDVLLGAIIEAVFWLDQGAPARAKEVLEKVSTPTTKGK